MKLIDFAMELIFEGKNMISFSFLITDLDYLFIKVILCVSTLCLMKLQIKKFLVIHILYGTCFFCEKL